MTTLVGTQKDFADAVKALVELDYDAVEAYEAAINRMTKEAYKSQLQKFKEDHQRHIRELNVVLKAHNKEEINAPSAKQWLTKGRVVLGGLIGDTSILQAMHSNEEDTNDAYEKMNTHEGKWKDAEDVLKRGLEDEKRHKKWIEDNVGAPDL